MKKVVAYNLSTTVIKEIEDRAKAENRSKSNWLDSFIVKAIFVDEVVNPVIVKPVKVKSKAFKPPTFNEVHTYCNERMNFVDPQSFIDHYTTNGWMRGKTKVKDWKACVHTWEKNAKPKAQSQFSPKTQQTIDNLRDI